VNIADNPILTRERHVERDAGRGGFLLPFVKGGREGFQGLIRTVA
jgi:hypothetical protein